jgi:hypothetical protein
MFPWQPDFVFVIVIVWIINKYDEDMSWFIGLNISSM